MNDLPMGRSSTASRAPSLIVRPVLLEDAEAISKLSAQLGYEASSEAIAQCIGQTFCRTDHAAFVACLKSMEDTEIVGWIEATLMQELQSPSFALITGLIVSEAHRGLGIGKQLCAEVESWGREQGVSKIRVTSRISRERAHRFYLREGFKRIKTWAVFEKMLS
ncbi:MAG TPA: GNAT family N-acetyltransferase [Edaphobacter sp.]|uniref:GNAT family N-acetyltransferase n=1 Tax=Edaphobacter sp. TaxID=1934404 RepID=UPI002C9F8AAE|nr:GNAT family N-acetyltransferase [Edaphobacter sp.]HUZ93364.1 GNAT family N-acetyltransferase [Edaphobacter sp.]